MATKTKPEFITSQDGHVEIVVGPDRYSNRQFAPMVHDREWPGLVARIAISLTERFGVIAGQPDGEDSSGRQKGTLMPVEEVAERAVSLAETLVAKLRERNLLVTLPSAIEFFDGKADDDESA